MQSNIVGTTMPALEIMLQPGETVISESGQLSWMTPNVVMKTHTQALGGGGFFGAVKRVASGGSLFMTEYTAPTTPGEVAFAAQLPGHIVPLEIAANEQYMIHNGGFICATPQVELTVGFQQSLGAGIFGGEGFLLQKVSGIGTAWMSLSGETIVRDLAAGESLMVHPGHVGAFQATMTFAIKTVPGVKNIFFGGDGLFLAQLTGPGRLWLQTLPIANLAHALIPYLPKPTNSSSSSNSLASAAVGGVVGSFFNKK